MHTLAIFALPGYAWQMPDCVHKLGSWSMCPRPGCKQVEADLLNVEEVGIDGVHTSFVKLLFSEGQERLLSPLLCYELAG